MNPTTTSTRAPSTGRRRVRRTVTALAMASAIALPAGVLAHDDGGGEIPPAPEGVTVLGYHGNDELVFTWPLGRVYGPMGGGLGAISGAPIEEVCAGSVPPDTLSSATQQPDGTWQNRVPLGGVLREAFVYEIEPDEDIFGFFGRVCPAIGAGEPAPDALASGEVRQRDRQWALSAPYAAYGGPQPAGRYSNSIRGHVEGSDGTTYTLVAKADYEIAEDGTETLFVDRFRLRPHD